MVQPTEYTNEYVWFGLDVFKYGINQTWAGILRYYEREVPSYLPFPKEPEMVPLDDKWLERAMADARTAQAKETPEERVARAARNAAG